MRVVGRVEPCGGRQRVWRGRPALVCCAGLALSAVLAVPCLASEAQVPESEAAGSALVEGTDATSEGGVAVSSSADETPATPTATDPGVTPDAPAAEGTGASAVSDTPAAASPSAAASVSGEAADAASQGDSGTSEPADADADPGASTSWRFQDGVPSHPAGEAESDVATYAAAQPWSWAGNGFVNANGNVIPGAVKRGVDVSSWDEGVDWDATASDVDFAVLRIGYGVGHYHNAQLATDAQFERNISECERVGLPCGVYFYSMATSVEQARTEARYVVSLLGGRHLDYPVYCDMEDASVLDAQVNVTEIVTAFCQVIADAGYTPGVYANLWWWNNIISDSVCAPQNRWVAQYADACTYELPYGMWQATSRGSVAGVGSNSCDINFVIDPNATASAKTDYSDVSADAWYWRNGWIQYVTDEGIMTGIRDASGNLTGAFEPEAQVTRGQVVTVLYRLTHPGTDDTTNPSSYRAGTHFTDATTPAFYNAAIAWCEEQGIVTGYKDGSWDLGTFGPNDPVTREQLATMLARFASACGGADTSGFGRGSLSSFSDGTSASDFAVSGLGWCVGKGIMSGDDDAPTLRPLGNATRAEFAKMVTVLTRDVLGSLSAGQDAARVELSVPYVDQNAEGMPLGCEGASLWMALRGKGYLQGVSYADFMATMPYSDDGDPNHGFAGNPARYDAGAYGGIYAAPLASWGARFGSVQDMSGSSQWQLVEELEAGNPVVVYVTKQFQAPQWAQWPFGQAVDNAHVVTLIGYDPATDTLEVADPNSGGTYWVDWWTFYKAYSACRAAVVVR